MQTLQSPFDWYPRDSIRWPSSDTKLKLVNDWVIDIDRTMQHVKSRRTAIQAGGACGIWPAKLAGLFDRVMTAEPCAENYECLVANCQPFTNITFAMCAFGSEPGSANLKRDSFEDGNAGAWYLVDGIGVPVVTIDSLSIQDCDLIMLDVEGHELEALRGAQKTIKHSRPVVVVESKQLPHMAVRAAAAGEFLESIGYRLADKFHNDQVFVPC